MKKLKITSTLAPIVLLATSLSMSGCIKSLGSADTYDLDVTIDTSGATIELWTGFGQNISKVLDDILIDFEAQTKIHVTHESKGSIPALQTAINLSATRGNYAHVALGYPDHFAGYINSNIQMRLDGLIENDSKREMVATDDEGYPVDAEGIRAMNYQDFYSDYTLENEELEFDKDGNNYILGLPFNKSTEVMVYNKTFIDWCATQDDLKDKIFVPRTWAEVKSVGLAAREFFDENGLYGSGLYSDGNIYDADPGIEGVTLILDAKEVTEDNFRPFTYDSCDNLFITLVRQYGGVYTELDKTRVGAGYAAFNDEAYRAKTLEAMDMWRDLDDNKICGIPKTYEALFCSGAFKSCKSLFNVGSTAGVNNACGSFKVGAAPIPQKDLDGQKFVISQGMNIALFNRGSEKEKVAAWKLMIFLSQQRNGYFAAHTGYFPTCESATNSAEYVDFIDAGISAAEKLQKECVAVNNNTYGSSTWTRFVDPAFRGSSSIRAEVDNIAGYIMYAKSDYLTNQAILNAVYVKISDYVRS